MVKITVPKSHPRYQSLHYRNLLVAGVEEGITSLHGLTAHGRGEAFDYLIGEETFPFAKSAIEAAAALLILAKHPVISVNGNTAALVPSEFVQLVKLIGNHLEINLFHASKEREKKIREHLIKHGATKVLLPGDAKIIGIDSNRRMISSVGQAKADVVFVPLEDGDRTAALEKMGKRVITVDLNPLSRTAQTATITIVDHVNRVMPLIIETVKDFEKFPKEKLEKMISDYDNKKILSEAIVHINKRLAQLGNVCEMTAR